MAPAAVFYPEELPQRIRQDSRLAAEVRLYDQLKRQMRPGWAIFYDVAWLGLGRPDGGPRDGQVDFVAAHPTKGVLLIEVKGGRIRFDGPRKQWISTDRHGRDHDIDPFEQVRKSKYALLEKLKATRALQGRWIELSHAVAFPDSARPAKGVTADAPTEIIMGAEDLGRLPDRFQEILEFSLGESNRSFEHGPIILDELTRLLARSLTLPNPLAYQADEEKREMVRLTDAQVGILSVLRRVRRAAIGGCAGSGKTFLAVAKAKQLAAEGFRTLLTCYTEPLAQLLERLTGQVENLHVAKLDDVYRLLLADGGRPDPTALFDTMQLRPDRPYDAIVVDEGQDFTADWWLALESCLREGRESIFYVFHDTHQTLYRGGGILPDGMTEFPLEDNVRNTQSICNALAHHYRGEVPIQPRGPVGSRVESHTYTTTDQLGGLLSKTLGRLLEIERFDNRDVVVLTPKPPARSCLWGLRLTGRLRLVDQEPSPRTHDVLCAPIDQFKGLERRVAIVTELDDDLPAEEAERRALCYVAFSRPRHYLIVFATPEVANVLPSDLNGKAQR